MSKKRDLSTEHLYHLFAEMRQKTSPDAQIITCIGPLCKHFFRQQNHKKQYKQGNNEGRCRLLEENVTFGESPSACQAPEGPVPIGRKL